MTELFYAWLAVAVLALIIEMFSGTLYGLSFSLSGFLLAIYVAVTQDTQLTLTQALIFAVTGAAFCFVFPKLFNRAGAGFKQGLDAVVGKTFPLKKVGDDFKVTVEGVDYLVNPDCVTEGFAPKAKVRVESHTSGVITVSLVK